MSNLQKRIEKIEERAKPDTNTTAALLKARIHEANERDNAEYKAVNCGVWWAFISGPDLVAKVLAILDAANLTEQLLGREIAERLRAGEDGRAHSAVESPEHGESLRAMAVGGIVGDLGDWVIDSIKTDKTLDDETRACRLTDVLCELNDIAKARESLRAWIGICPAATVGTVR
ncbi:MAG: hypothetical protein FJ009_20305 [Chloroflexi bacterium]|nr:hypothetical protein [Chloroflexota bacterium]